MHHLYRRGAILLIGTWVLAAYMGFGHRGSSAPVPPAEGPRPSPVPPSADLSAAPHRAALDRYCVSCHNTKARTAGLALDRVDIASPGEEPEIWEKVVRKLRSGSMPPAGMPRPDAATYGTLAGHLERALDAAAEAAPNPGRSLAHRLNRVEYANAVRDLLEVEIDGEELFPAEDTGKGFDNLAALLSVSPVLMERYLSAARQVSRLALGDAAGRPVSQTYQAAENLRGSAGLISVQDDRAGDDLPFGSRGGVAVRHAFAADGEYHIRIGLQLDGNYYIRGLMGEPHRLDVFLDGERVASFSVGGERRGASGALHTRDGNIYIGDPAQQEYEYFAGGDLEARFRAAAGARLVAVTFQKKTYQQEGLLEVSPRAMARDISNYKGGDPGIASFTITGPFSPQGVAETASRRRVFVCRPEAGGGPDAEESCARTILARLARMAYRRPVADGDLDELLTLFRTGSREEGFEEGIRLALQGMLVSPAFLFRVEQAPPVPAPGSAHRISDLELASRLSFFLWGSIPDEALLQAAEGGRLADPAELQRHVDRMLADRRARALVRNFASQWMHLRNVRQRVPNTSIFPDFDQELRHALEQETELFFESLLREDRSVLDLLSADHTFVNERLARHYGIPGIHGSHFRRVRVADENRRGILGHGSILTVTSRANRTSPVLRGKWVLENLLGAPPPPPPPDVPALNERPGPAREMSMRQRIEEHRANPACASCHAGMDPIGFALENFDAVGKWRVSEGGAAVDTVGVLPDGTRFQGPAELRAVLLSRSRQFVQTSVEKLLTYALGRELEHYDMPAVRRILSETEPEKHRWSSLISAVIRSVPFQMRRAQP